MLLSLLRYLRGYVRFKATGRFPERFINIASRNGMRLWEVKRTADGFEACMYISSYLRAIPLARGAGARLRVKERLGLPTAVRKYRDRVGVAVGAFVFVLTVFIMSQFIWSIDITGLETVSESRMREMLSECGLYVGAFKPALDSGTVSRSVMLDEPRVGWMAVNITGSYASVEIKEESPAPEVPDISSPCNVKASRDGVILSMSVGEGETMIKEGSGVVKGQLLVSGVVENLDGSSRLVRAEASVKASTYHSAEFSIPVEPELTVPVPETGERRRLVLAGLELPLSAYKPVTELAYSVDRYESPAPLSVALPVGIVTERVTSMETHSEPLDENSAKEILMKHAKLYEAFTLSGCTVTDRSFSLRRENDRYVLDCVCCCEEEIAVQEPIGVGETE